MAWLVNSLLSHIACTVILMTFVLADFICMPMERDMRIEYRASLLSLGDEQNIIFYNRGRWHSYLVYISTVEYEAGYVS
jgi:hypothetical protein